MLGQCAAPGHLDLTYNNVGADKALKLRTRRGPLSALILYYLLQHVTEEEGKDSKELGEIEQEGKGDEEEENDGEEDEDNQ